MCRSLAVLPVTVCWSPHQSLVTGMASSEVVTGHTSGESSDSMSSEGEFESGYEYPFVQPVDAKYECPICLLVLRNPMQTECGHRFCKACIVRWKQEPVAKCPACGEILADQTLFPDNFAKREINNLKVHCTNNGCTEKVELVRLKNHLDVCQFCEVQCPRLCGKFINKLKIPHHLEFDCDNRTIRCPQCEQEILFIEKMHHEQKQCSELEVECQYCQTQMKKHQVQEHCETVCPGIPVPCKYVSVGCTQQPVRSEIEKHFESNLQLHMDMLLSELQHLSLRQRSTVPSKLRRTSVSFDTGTAVLARAGSLPVYSFDPHMTVQDPIAANFGASMEPKDPECYSVKSRTSHAYAEAEYDLQQKPSLDAESLQQKRDVVQDPMTMLKEYYNARLGKLENKIEDQNRIIRELSERNLETESRFCNGTFIWKVEEYSKKRREAILGDVTVLHSPGFYSGLYGYRLCIRLNLNGVDSALGRHMSLFVHFMKGDYDDLLPWPFRGKITLSVLDQNEICENRQHLSEVLTAKPNLAAFKKPVAHRNHKGFGYMEFAPIALIESSTFIKDDIIYIKAIVEHGHDIHVA